MYCKNCQHPVTEKDEYCPNCTELLTEFTVIPSLTEEKNTEKQKGTNEDVSSSKKEISKRGKQLIAIGFLCVCLQILSYWSSYNVKFNLSNISGVGYFIGRNFLIIIGIGLFIKGSWMRE